MGTSDRPPAGDDDAVVDPARAGRASGDPARCILRGPHTPDRGVTGMIQRYEVGPRMSELAVHNGVAYLAGQIPEDTSQDIAGQTRQVLEAIDALLAQAGTDKSRILRAEIFLADIADFAGMNQAWDAWVVPGHTPPRATVQAALARPEWRVEIVVTAAA